jgi:hypothetical protein
MRKFGTTLLLGLFVIIVHGYAKDRVLSRQVLQDTYVALGYETAQGFVGEYDEEAFISAKILPEDREALSNVREALRKWKRYIITVEPRDAELLIAVRSGRVASVDGGVRVGNIPIGTPPVGGRGTSVVPVFGGEAGPANDYLAIYQADQGHEGPNLWQQSKEAGLVGKNPPLFESFKKDVDDLAKKFPPKH